MIVSALVFAQACLPPAVQPGTAEVTPRFHDEEPTLIELARVPGEADRRALLVVYPRAVCSGWTNIVLVDERGEFVGAVSPGTASLVSVRAGDRSLYAIPSIEITSPVRASAVFSKVAVPPLPAGIVFRSRAWSIYECGTSEYADAEIATKSELEELLDEEDLRWLEPRRHEGQAWLDAHGERMREVLARSAR